VKSDGKEPSPRYQASIQLLRASESLWNSSRLFLKLWNISPSQFNILNLLRGKKGGCTQIELSRQLIMHRSNVTGLVDRLEARGLVGRKTMPGDRRVFQVMLTGRGLALLKNILPHYYHAADAIWDGMTEEQVKRLSGEVATVVRNAERVAAASSAVTRARKQVQRTPND
jgi:DNA-binding MarR family transcriptional regulator